MTVINQHAHGHSGAPSGGNGARGPAAFHGVDPQQVIRELGLVEGFQPEWLLLTEDDLPYADGIPMDHERCRLGMNLLIEPLTLRWAHRPDAYVGGNMFVYFSPFQKLTDDFRGPDVLAAVGVPKRERASWLVWQEEKPPDVVIEILSHTTKRTDRGQKKDVYEKKLKAPEYYLHDPFTGETQGFALRDGVYQSVVPDSRGIMRSPSLDLGLIRWEGLFDGVFAPWLRWTTLEGDLIPTKEEVAIEATARAEQERSRAEQETRRAEQETRRAEQETRRADGEQQRAERLAAMLRAMGIDPDA